MRCKGRNKDVDLDEVETQLHIDVHQVDVEELCRRFNTNIETGLTSEAALENLKNNGMNRLTLAPTLPEWINFFKHFFDGFYLLLWVESLICFAAYGYKTSGAEKTNDDNLYLGIVLVVAIVVTGLFSYFQRRKTTKIMQKFQNLIPQYTSCVRNGEKVMLMTEELTVGDIVEVQWGDIIPADIRILKSSGFKVDNSPLTGESVPLHRSPHCTSENPLETKNLAFFATHAVDGNAVGMVVNVGDCTVMGRIAGLTSTIEPFKTAIAEELKHFIHTLASFAFVLAFIFFLLALALGHHWLDALVFVIGTIIANVPEGLLTTVTVCSSLTADRMASKNCLVKHLGAIETLGSTSIICSDKTGTLTQNLMVASRIWIDGKIHDVEPPDDRTEIPNCQTLASWIPLERCIALCSRAEFKRDDQALPIHARKVYGDSSEAALLKHVEMSLGDTQTYRQGYPKLAEIPFNTFNKFQISVHEDTAGKFNFIVMKGAPERLLKRCQTIMLQGREVPLTDEWRLKFSSACQFMGERGERILGFCDLKLPTEVYPIGFEFNQEEVNFPMTQLRFLGLVSLTDPPRPCIKEAVAKCRSAGIKVIMITGDHPITAKAIAQDVGIISPGNKTVEDFAEEKGIPLEQVDTSNITAAVVLGSELEAISNDEIDEIVLSNNELVFARTTPEQKLLIVESCQRMFAIVAVTGDGVNDSLALKKADVGIAMGISGTEVAKEAADMILLDDNFASIVDGIEEGRLFFDNLKKSVAYSLTTNIAEITPFMLFIFGGFPLALGTVTILCIDLGTDIVPAVSLAYELPESDLMKRNPRNPYTDRLVGDKLISTAYGQIGIMQASAGFLAYFFIMAEHGFLPQKLFGLRRSWDSLGINDVQDSYSQEWTYEARKDLEFTCHTAFFVAIVVVQWADLIICKTRTLSIFSQGMNNWVLNFGLVFETCVAAFLSYTPGTEDALNMYPLMWHWWLPGVPFSILILIYDECRKVILRNLEPGSWLEKEAYY